MDLKITPCPLKGTVTPPPSKSQSHRVLLAAALAGGRSELSGLADSQDIQATAACLRAMGACLEEPERGRVRVHGLGHSIPQHREEWLARIDCGESGSTLRFLIPVVLLVLGGGIFTGRGRLMERPQGPYLEIFKEKGICFEQKDGVLTVRGELPPGRYALPGNVSSQFVTGLLYALPLLDGDSEIVLTSPLESRGYVDMTLDVLQKFGIYVETEKNGNFFAPGGQHYQSRDMAVEADWSQAGFWYAAMGLGNSVKVTGLDPNSTQGDRIAAEYYELLCRCGDAELDVSGCPDLVPPLAVHAALRPGQSTCLVNAGRLRLKESDRLSSVTQVLNALGAKVEEGPDSLAFSGVSSLKGGVRVSSFNDHRIAMMAAVAATRCEAPVTLTGAESVNKSYPTFWEEYRRLGGQFEEVPL